MERKAKTEFPLTKNSPTRRGPSICFQMPKNEEKILSTEFSADFLPLYYQGSHFQQKTAVFFEG